MVYSIQKGKIVLTTNKIKANDVVCKLKILRNTTFSFRFSVCVIFYNTIILVCVIDINKFKCDIIWLSE